MISGICSYEGQLLEQLEKKRKSVSPDKLNKLIARYLSDVKQLTPLLKQIRTSADEDTFARRLGFPKYAEWKEYPAVTTEYHKIWGHYLPANQLYLPLAVQEALRYEGVETVLDWVKKLPIASQIDWDKSVEPSFEAIAYSSAVPLKQGQTDVPVAFEAHGNRDEKWLYLTYTLSGKHIGETGIDYLFKSQFRISKGRYADTKEIKGFPDPIYESHSQRERRNKLYLNDPDPLKIRPITAKEYDENAIANSAVVTIGIKLCQENVRSIGNTEQLDEISRRNGEASTWTFAISDWRTGGKSTYTIPKEGHFVALGTTIGVDFQGEDLPEYIASLRKNLDVGLTHASQLLFGETIEKTTEIMRKRLGFSDASHPKIHTPPDAGCLTFDYTGCFPSRWDGSDKISLRTYDHRALKVIAQKCLLINSFPRIVAFDEGKTKRDLDPRRIVVFTYNPEKKLYFAIKLDPYVKSVLKGQTREIPVEQMCNELIPERHSGFDIPI